MPSAILWVPSPSSGCGNGEELRSGEQRSNVAFPSGIFILGGMIKAIEKPPVDLELKRRIQELIEYKGGGFNQENVSDIIENALKLLADVKDTGDVKVIQTALRELRYAFR